jgi:hypothetical protein
MQKQEKGQSARITECLNVLTKLEDELKVPKENPSIRLLRKRMATYWKDGKTQEERIPLVNSNRNIVYKFPRWAHQEVEVLLRVSPLTFTELPAALAAELATQPDTEIVIQAPSPITSPPPPPSPEGAAESQTSSATQSGPSHPSLPE